MLSVPNHRVTRESGDDGRETCKKIIRFSIPCIFTSISTTSIKRYEFLFCSLHGETYMRPFSSYTLSNHYLMFLIRLSVIAHKIGHHLRLISTTDQPQEYYCLEFLFASQIFSFCLIVRNNFFSIDGCHV